MLGFIGEESSASSIGMIFIKEESSAFLLGMMLDVLEPLRKNLLLSHRGSVLDMLDPLGKNLMLLPW